MLKSQLKDKINLTLNNSLELGTMESKGKGRQFVSRFIEAGVAHYQEFGDVLITKETLDKFISTLVGCPVIIKHKDIDDTNVDKERVGVISEVWFNDCDGWYYCGGIIWDKQAIDLVKNQGWSVSCTYDFESDFENKIHNGKKIDMEFINGEFLHLALVDNPRYERANIVMNAKDNEKGKWITVKGTHIFIPEGADAGEVIEKKFGDTEDEENKETSILDIIKKQDEQIRELKEKGVLKKLQMPKSFEERQEEEEELVNLTEYHFNRLSKEDLQKEFEHIQKEFIRRKDRKNTPEYREYKKMLLKIKGIYEKRFKTDSKKDLDKANNSKGDTIMSVFNELTNFIRSVVNNEKGEEMTDKRKLIDEIAGMMKSAGCDDEIIRTAIKKMEKIGYEKSEADNEDIKEEKKEEFEEEKEIAENKKAKKEKEKAKNEEEKKEVKNSMEIVNKVVNKSFEVENSLYISQSKRIELGNNY